MDQQDEFQHDHISESAITTVKRPEVFTVPQLGIVILISILASVIIHSAFTRLSSEIVAADEPAIAKDMPTIKESPIKLLSPIGGESYCLGSEIPIRWIAPQDMDVVNISLAVQSGELNIGQFRAHDVNGQGSMIWKGKTINSQNYVTPGDTYKIIVGGRTEGGEYSKVQSDRLFELKDCGLTPSTTPLQKLSTTPTPTPASKPFLTFDLYQCTAQTKYYAMDLGSVSVKVIGPQNNMCKMHVTNEIEGGYSISECLIPKNLSKLKFGEKCVQNIGEARTQCTTGFSVEIVDYCSVIKSGNVFLEENF